MMVVPPTTLVNVARSGYPARETTAPFPAFWNVMNEHMTKSKRPTPTIAQPLDTFEPAEPALIASPSPTRTTATATIRNPDSLILSGKPRPKRSSTSPMIV